MKIIHALIAVLAVAALTACAPLGAPPVADLPPTEPLADEATVDAAEAAESPVEEGPAEAELGSTHTWNDGLAIELSGVERALSGEYAMPAGEPYVRFTMQVQNDTGGPVDLSLVWIECQVGEDGRIGDLVYDYDAGLGDGFSSTVMDGRDATADFGCAMPEDESYLQIEVHPQDEAMLRQPVFFIGDVP
ncbi:hypothetical protein [Allonocardiopsis opalescens]|uniref:DUF4352 domain-containing protein n=1 Tax=Allonocardiopsis opalescens TaxID=1144618 RepID=A0A2T0PVJ4_9ACTN|nr:hypothetical protein [Allonocardiopsis opalescens]PRX95549.1 hypothetical protein CLV72_109158 [Allonocardiopsis opalescens]